MASQDAPRAPKEPLSTYAEHADGDNALKPSDAINDAAATGQGVSGYENLSLWQTIKAFKVNAAVCFAVSFSAATDGYQIG